MIKPLATSSLIILMVSGCTSTNSAYLYDDSSLAALVSGDIPIWEDADSAKSEVRVPRDADTLKKMKCLARPKAPTTIVKQVGSVTEVKWGGCNGFVNSKYVHKERSSDKYG